MTSIDDTMPIVQKLTYQISNMAKPKIDLSYKQLISFMYGDSDTFTKRFMIYIVYLGILFNKYSCVKGETTRLQWINAMQPQYERIEKTLTYFLITVSRLKKIADAIRESDDVYFAYKNYNQECLKIYRAIDVAVLCKLMTQSEKDLCCKNIKYSHVFLQRCLSSDIDVDNIEILKIGYLSSQHISELEFKHREEVKKAYDSLMFYDIPMNLDLLLCCLNKYINQLHELIIKDYSNVKYKYIACVFIKIYIYIHNRMIKPEINKNNLKILENIVCYSMDDLCIDDDNIDIHKHYDNLFRILDNRTIIQEDLYMQYYCGDMTCEEYHKQYAFLMKVALRYY